jgi:dTDP-4-amino-4,6-dideoxygalactose transaminase
MTKIVHKAGTQNIPITKPWCDARILKQLYKNYITGQWKMGATTIDFENKFASYLDLNNSLTSISLNSNIAGWKIILQCIGIQKNDEIMITPMTHASIIEAILDLNAIPIFVDVEYDSLNIDHHDIETKITPNTKTIILEHFGGYPCDMDHIMMLADKHKLLIIEDCSNATGGEYGGVYAGQKIGSLGNISYFSMAHDNILPMGIGSMIVFAKNTDFENKIKNIRDLDAQYQMTDILAAIGLGQLEQLDHLNHSRREVVKRYNSRLSKYKQIESVHFISDKDVKHYYIIKIHGIPLDKIKNYLESRNISVRNIYPLIYSNPKYMIYNKNNTPVAESLCLNSLIIPLYPSLRDCDIVYILRSIKKYIIDNQKTLNQKVYKLEI